MKARSCRATVSTDRKTGSGRRMSGTQLWLLASVAFTSLTSLADGAPLEVMSAPNLLRAGTAENIFVECQDCTGGDIRVDINVMNHPAKTKILTGTSVTLKATGDFQQFAQITIPAVHFSTDPNIKQYVYLQAQFPGRLLEKVVLVSFESGYIFIQTDKPVYTPNSLVRYRFFAVTPRMEPVERDDQTDATVAIEIVTPEGSIRSQEPASLRGGIFSGFYELGEFVSPGLWKVVARFHSRPQQSYSAEFEVKEYVLPSYEVRLTPQSSFFYVDSPDLIINIKATYGFAEVVDGAAYVLFGVLYQGQKKSFQSSLQRVAIERGDGVATLRREHITQAFPNTVDLVGSSIYVSVSVLTESGAEMVETELRGIPIVTSPYTMHFKRTSKYFKPGMTFDVLVKVVNPDETPAQGVAVVVDPGAVQGVTAANGIATLTVNTVAETTALSITARTNDPGVLPERQARATMLAQPYFTLSNSYIHIAVGARELHLGDNLKTFIFLNRQPKSFDVTYLILSRGQLVKFGRYRISQSQILVSLVVPITKDMLPSFRMVVYYHPSDNEVVSDSVWVDVKDTCIGSLKVETGRTGPAMSYEPNKMIRLKITGDPEATVGLVAVGKGVLNNKHHLTQEKVWDVLEKHDFGCTPGGGKDSMGVFYDAGLLFESSTASGTPVRQDLKCPSSSRKRRSEEDDSYIDSSEISSRTTFTESWLWSEAKLPACPTQNPNCASTSHVLNTLLPASMTTWQLSGISLSRSNGICVGDPLELIVRKQFFIDLRLPYAVVRGEQIEVKAILHNYIPDPITVRVDLIEEEEVCSSAFKRGRYRQEIEVGPQTTRSVPFIIIPMKIGVFHIEAKASVKDSFLSDGIKKMLRVVPEGVLVKSSQVVILDPTKNGAGDKQEVTISSDIPTVGLVPNTPTSAEISLKGIASLVENAISGESMGSLILQPSGSGEQNMMRMTLSVVATTYLDKTNQWESVGWQKRNEALEHITTGYRNQLVYRKADGSFAAWANTQSGTWLTAYVVKVFSMASSLVSVQTSLICDAVSFLIGSTQQPNGSFKEVGKVYHGEMTGDVRGTDSDASMTAFCLIALQESQPLCAAAVNNLQSSVDKAVTYLETRLSSLTNPYAVAMTSYALANEGKLNQEILYKSASPELSHWPVNKGQLYTLEATAYALLALVKFKAFEEARPVVRWFNQQPKVFGGYGSTQATIMVYQAVAEYWARAKEQEYHLNVDVMLPDRLRPMKYTFNRENHHTTRIAQFRTDNRDVRVTATGTGQATLTMVSLFYAIPKEKPDCQKFNMLVELIPEKMDDDEKIYNLRIEVMYNNRERDATMSVLDIGLLSGFTPNTNDLDALSKGPARTIAKYEVNTVLSDRRSLIVYLDKVSHRRPEEISFRIHQKLKLAVLQPAAVSVYEYYDQTHCVKFYHPQRKDGQLLQLCRNELCTCADGMCSIQMKGKISNEERGNRICSLVPGIKTDYAYKVRLEEFTGDLSTDIYTMRVIKVIKEGSLDVDALRKLRTFLSYPHCRSSLDLQKGRTYLIMGTSTDIHRDEPNQSYEYVLGEITWIEYWPTDAECQTAEHRPTCSGIQGMDDLYSLFGCLE